MKRIFLGMLLGLLVALSGGAWLQRDGRGDFRGGGGGGRLEQRLEVLESENERLRRALGERVRAEQAESDFRAKGEIAEVVSRMRGLEVLAPVDYRRLAREELPALLEGKLSEMFTEEEIRNAQAGYVALGLLPEGYDLRQAYIDLFAEQVAAFYDQHEDALYLFEGKALDNPVNRMIFAHEFVHALQDQHFALEDFPLEIKTNDDLAVAASALVEGDATLLMTQFFAEDAKGEGMLGSLFGELFSQGMRQLQDAPPFLRESLLFPYVEGQKFVARLHARGGYGAVDRALRTPPVSTKEILHPEIYLGDRTFEPVEPEWGGGIPGDIVFSNVLGEFGLGLMLGAFVDEARAEAAADGWSGDGYRVFRTGQGVGYVLKTFWEDAGERDEYADAQREALANRYALANGWTGGDGGGWFAEAGGRYLALVFARDAGVGAVLVDAPSESLRGKLLHEQG